jgi:uncharacterized repeat protein (TIGR04138 family)
VRNRDRESSDENMKKKLEKIAQEDGRYNISAIKFIYEGLDSVKKQTTEPGHVTGQALCEQLRKLAVEKWGLLAKLVLNTWGVNKTRDFGEIVYLMIKHNWMSAQPTDTIEDFDDVYDFKTVFKDQFEF